MRTAPRQGDQQQIAHGLSLTAPAVQHIAGRDQVVSSS
jgi:hypothetical protein